MTFRNRKIQTAVAVTLALVVAYNLNYFFGKDKRKSFVIDSLPDAEIVRTGEAPRWASGDYTIPEDWGGNPFALNGVVSSSDVKQTDAAVKAPALWRAPRIKVSGSGVADGARFVLVDGCILKPGDRLGAGRIKEINPTSLIVEYDKGTQKIAIP